MSATMASIVAAPAEQVRCFDIRIASPAGVRIRRVHLEHGSTFDAVKAFLDANPHHLISVPSVIRLVATSMDQIIGTARENDMRTE